MSEMLFVHKGVPIPPIDRSANKRRRKYPIETMEVGDMIFVPGRSVKSVVAYISRISKDVNRKFSARGCHAVPVGMVGGVRKWELAEQGADGAEEGTGVWRTE